MNRRRLLQRTGAVGVAALAGCLQSGPGGEGTDSPTPRIRDTGFEVTGVSSETTEQTASVAFGSPLIVTGSTTGNDGCYTAVLADVTYDHLELRLVVRAKEREDAGACTQALVVIDYEATVTFAGEGPERVVVKHDSMGEVRAVTTARRPE